MQEKMIEKTKKNNFFGQDQHMMVNTKIIEKMIELANVNKNDVVLEIGAGYGILTKALASTKAKVIAIEIDERFIEYLNKIKSKNVEIINGNALKIIDKINFDKIVSNIPYSICEPLINKLINKKFTLAVISIPKNFYKIISAEENEKNYSKLTMKVKSFFEVKLLYELEKSDFYPPPKTDSVVIILKPLSEEDYRKNPIKFLMRDIFSKYKNRKLKNALREAIINLNKNFYSNPFTKNMARELIKKMKIDEKVLEKKIDNLSLEDLKKIKESFHKLLI